VICRVRVAGDDFLRSPVTPVITSNSLYRGHFAFWQPSAEYARRTAILADLALRRQYDRVPHGNGVFTVGPRTWTISRR
jgi:hypothetical protein